MCSFNDVWALRIVRDATVVGYFPSLAKLFKLVALKGRSIINFHLERGFPIMAKVKSI